MRVFLRGVCELEGVCEGVYTQVVCEGLCRGCTACLHQPPLVHIHPLHITHFTILCTPLTPLVHTLSTHILTHYTLPHPSENLYTHTHCTYTPSHTTCKHTVPLYTLPHTPSHTTHSPHTPSHTLHIPSHTHYTFPQTPSHTLHIPSHTLTLTTHSSHTLTHYTFPHTHTPSHTLYTHPSETPSLHTPSRTLPYKHSL